MGVTVAGATGDGQHGTPDKNNERASPHHDLQHAALYSRCGVPRSMVATRNAGSAPGDVNYWQGVSFESNFRLEALRRRPASAPTAASARMSANCPHKPKAGAGALGSRVDSNAPMSQKPLTGCGRLTSR